MTVEGNRMFWALLDQLERDAASRRGNHGRLENDLARQINKLIAERRTDWRKQ